jgi:hypothetical protein
MAESSVKLGVTPLGRELLAKKTIAPGASVSGLVEISNLTAAPLDVEPRLRSLGSDSPDALRLELTAGRRTLYSGTLGHFHARTRLRPRAAQRLRLRLSMPRSGVRDVQGRSARLVLRFAVKKAGRR